MKVRAIEFGYYKHRRRPGDVFDFDGDKCPKWCEPASKPLSELPSVDYDGMSKKEIVLALLERGATFDSASRRDLLLEQLKGVRK